MNISAKAGGDAGWIVDGPACAGAQALERTARPSSAGVRSAVTSNSPPRPTAAAIPVRPRGTGRCPPTLLFACWHAHRQQRRGQQPRGAPKTGRHGASGMPLTEVLARWHDFYALVGTASATMVGLLFVAATVASGVFTGDRRAALRLFLSASVVNFSSLLAASMVVMTPLGNWTVLGLLIVACALFGLAHSALALRDTVRDNLMAKIDLEDRAWYLVMPVLGYLAEAASGVTLALRREFGCAALALSMGLLLLVGLHNAWDITVWTVTRRRD